MKYNYPFACTDNQKNRRSGGSSSIATQLKESFPFAIGAPMFDANGDIWTGDGRFFVMPFFIVPGSLTKIKSIHFCIGNNYRHPALGCIIAQESTASAHPSYCGTNLGEFQIVNGDTMGHIGVDLNYTIPSNALYLFVAFESYSDLIYARQGSYGNHTSIIPAGIGVKERGVGFGSLAVPILAVDNPLYRVVPWVGLEVY